MVFQNVYLFNDTIRANICFGKPDATEEEMIEAAKKARCHGFIMALPKGYDTVVGEVANVELVDSDGDVIASAGDRVFTKTPGKGLYVAFKYNIKEMEVESSNETL